MIIYENSSIIAGIPLKQYLSGWMPQAKGFGRIGTHLIWSWPKRKVCIILGDHCWIFIYNRSPDGTVTNSLQGLSALYNELAKNSEIN